MGFKGASLLYLSTALIHFMTIAMPISDDGVPIPLTYSKDLPPNNGRPPTAGQIICLPDSSRGVNTAAGYRAVHDLGGQWHQNLNRCGDGNNGGCQKLWSPAPRPTEPRNGATIWICGNWYQQFDCNNVAMTAKTILPQCGKPGASKNGGSASLTQDSKGPYVMILPDDGEWFHEQLQWIAGR